MPTGNQYIKDLIELIEGSVADFNKAMPGIQDEVFDSIIELSKDLKLPARTIEQQAANLKIIGKIKDKINSVILNPDYVVRVREFAKAFDKVTVLQNKYFNTVISDFGTKKLYDEIRKAYVDATIDNLTESGITAISEDLRDMLLRNTTSGSSFASMIKEVRSYLEGENGALVKYARQITTDSLNQYSASYTKAVTDDLGWQWFRYVGSNIKTTRPFCLAMTEKDYVFYKELTDIARGQIDGKQVSLAGLIPGTNAANIQVNRGGYNCGHQLYPVSEAVIPKEIRIAAYDKYGIKYDDEGFAEAA